MGTIIIKLNHHRSLLISTRPGSRRINPPPPPSPTNIQIIVFYALSIVQIIKEINHSTPETEEEEEEEKTEEENEEEEDEKEKEKDERRRRKRNYSRLNCNQGRLRPPLTQSPT